MTITEEELKDLLTRVKGDTYNFDENTTFIKEQNITVESGANFYNGSQPHQGRNHSAKPGEMPKELQTDEAKALLGKFQKTGMLDENYQPVKLSRAQKALLANTIAEELRLKNKWSLFEKFWNIKALSSAYTRGMKQDNVVDYIKDIEKILNS